jgi:hypothetical protein
MARFWRTLFLWCVTAKQRFKDHEMAMSFGLLPATPERHNQASVQFV